MKQENKVWDLLKPLVVLVCICLVVSALLGFTNNLTAPIIEENARIKAEETRASVLEGAQGFEEVAADYDALNVTGIFAETNGLGYVITSANKGYDGDVVVTVGLNPDGIIVGLAADVSTETVGVGTKAGQSSYLDNYMGQSENVDSVDTITSATYSSSAVKTGVNAALAAFAAIR